MSKIKEIRNQYPELNVSVIDLFTILDGTKTNKYLPLMCKLLSHRFQPSKIFGGDYEYEMNHIKERVKSFGLDMDNLNDKEIYPLWVLLDYFDKDDIHEINSFKELNEKGLIVNNDISSYKSFEEIRQSVTLANLKNDDKEMRSQVIREFEDDTWLAIRPMTFASSSKYGSATKWCTTFTRNKEYFYRYWHRGILCYFINKKTGLKFAMFKSLDINSKRELSFWNSSDNRIDFLELDIEDYMFPVIKQILKSDKTNKDLCSPEIRKKVDLECNPKEELKLSSMDLNEVEEGEITMESRPVYQLRPLRRLIIENEEMEAPDEPVVEGPFLRVLGDEEHPRPM